MKNRPAFSVSSSLCAYVPIKFGRNVLSCGKKEYKNTVTIITMKNGIIPRMTRLIGSPVTLTAVKIFTATGGEEEPIIRAPVAKMQ